MNDGPLIVQSDKTILLEVDHELATEARHAIAAFAELERAPEHVHSYRLTPLGLWNARAAGLDAEKVLDTLLTYSRFPVPHSLLIDVEETMSRYGRLRLEKDPQHGLVMRTSDYPVLEEVSRAKKIAPLLGPRIDGETVVVHSSQRGQLKQLLLKLGWPAEDLAGYVDGTRTPSCSTNRAGSCGRTSNWPRRTSGPAAAASSSCPAAPARRWSGRPPWPQLQPPH